MPHKSEQFQAAIEKFDAANAQDPTLIGGAPAELVYARRMTGWLQRLYPDAAEALQLAARAQHIRRWMIPRSRYPMTRQGYHQWRTTLYSFHADEAAKILREVGYDDITIERVRFLLRKEKLKADPETQALEDVACLVFLENYLADFAIKHEEQKVIDILRRTWKKMSERGRAAAMELPLKAEARRLVEMALAS
jgi:Domain of unknown function (DUF4202)